MKKLFLFLLLAVSATAVMAQVNPKPGFVITNNGDTLRGMIDLRTNIINTKQCYFMADGKTGYTMYYPEDIAGYTFDIGKCYVTKKFNIEGESKLYFAELLVQGVVNMYKVVNFNKERLYVINEYGEMACVIAENSGESFTQTISAERNAIRNKLYHILRNSPTTVERLKDKTFILTEDNMIDLVRDYHKNTCSDGSECITFTRKKSTELDGIRPQVSLGYMWRTNRGEKIDAAGFSISAGAEFSLARIKKDLFAEAALRYSRLACKSTDYSFYDNYITIEGGVIFKLPVTEQLHWYIAPGINLDLAGWTSNEKNDHPNGSYVYTKEEIDSGINWFEKLYIGTGFCLNIAKHDVFIEMRYRGDHAKHFNDARLLISTGLKW